MYVSKWTPEKGSCHLWGDRAPEGPIPTSSVIFGVGVREQKSPPHSHADADEWFMVVEGKGNIETDGQPNILTPGCIVYSPPYAWHAFQGIGGPFRYLYGIGYPRTYIRGEQETVGPVEGRNSIVLSLREARAEASGGKLSLTLLEPRNVCRNNCLGVNYSIYAPGTSVETHTHETLEQVIYVTSGTARIRVREEVCVLSKDEAVYIPLHTAHSLKNKSNEPLATVNAYYPSRNDYHLWKENIEAFITKIDPLADPSLLRYPSEL
jgi:mannose-6-phosphate isomerase-like protein (cupin superfamily)